MLGRVLGHFPIQTNKYAFRPLQTSKLIKTTRMTHHNGRHKACHRSCWCLSRSTDDLFLEHNKTVAFKPGSQPVLLAKAWATPGLNSNKHVQSTKAAAMSNNHMALIAGPDANVSTFQLIQHVACISTCFDKRWSDCNDITIHETALDWLLFQPFRKDPWRTCWSAVSSWLSTLSCLKTWTVSFCIKTFNFFRSVVASNLNAFWNQRQIWIRRHCWSSLSTCETAGHARWQKCVKPPIFISMHSTHQCFHWHFHTQGRNMMSVRANIYMVHSCYLHALHFWNWKLVALNKSSMDTGIQINKLSKRQSLKTGRISLIWMLRTLAWKCCQVRQCGQCITEVGKVFPNWPLLHLHHDCCLEMPQEILMAACWHGSLKQFVSYIA